MGERVDHIKLPWMQKKINIDIATLHQKSLPLLSPNAFSLHALPCYRLSITLVYHEMHLL